jgi:hypothetical protein
MKIAKSRILDKQNFLESLGESQIMLRAVAAVEGGLRDER